MRVATLFVTALLIGGTAYAGDTVPQRQAANQPARSASAMKTVDLSEVVNPADTLGEAKVEDSQGATVGQVQKVVTGDTGAIAHVDVAIKTAQAQKVVALTPAQVRYVPFSGKLRTTMTADQLGALPPAK
jgi:hypothetical protein